MDLSIDQSSLGRALRLAGRVVPAKPAHPFLAAVLLEAQPGRLTLTATDGDLSAVTILDADVTAAGRTALPARLLGEYVAQLPDEPVRLSVDATSRRVQVRCSQSVADLATADPDGVPSPPAAEGDEGLDLDPGRLLAAVERVGFAAARDHSRPVLIAVLFDIGAAGLTLAATDGFRLARAWGGVVERPCRHGQLLVPTRAVTEFGRLLADARTARLVLTPDGRCVHLIADQARLFTHQVEGRFPDLTRVIPTAWRTRVRVATADLRQALRLTSPFVASGDARPVVLDAAPGRLRLQARGDERGAAESAVPATVEGTPQAVALNARLLSDLLDAVRDPELELAWTGTDAPVVVREAGQPATDDLWLVMPLYGAAVACNERTAATT